jgi:hypothetical protein
MLAAATGCAGPQIAARVTVPHPTATNIAPHLGCQSGGCAFVPGPAQQDLPLAQVDALLAEVGATPVGSDSLALDTLLFHDAEVRRRLVDPTAPVLSPAWSTALRAELAKRTATFSLRITDEHGRVRVFIPDTLMALGAKKHLAVAETDLGTPMNANGTIVRVGQRHLWYRM